MSTNFRTRMFGGFDREDVIAYIGKITQENQAQVEELTRSGDELQVQADEYAKIRDHIAEIEISAHRRTEEFRAQAIRRIHELVERQRTWCSESSARYGELLQRFGEKLEAARNVLQDTDLSGFEEMLRSLNELDEGLDK